MLRIPGTLELGCDGNFEMPKATLQFTLPEERIEHTDALNGTALRAVITNWLDFVRAKLKYEELSKVEENVWCQARTKMLTLLEDYDITPYP